MERVSGKISIIITHWAQNDFRSMTMRRSLASLTATTKDLPVEIIVVDNGANWDDSIFLLDLIYHKHIQFYLRNSENLYFGFARNQGLDIACGEYVVISDNDIFYKQNWLSKSLEILNAFPERKIAVTPLRADRSHRNEKHWVEWFEVGNEKFPANMRAGSNCWVMRRKDFDQVGRFRNHGIAGTKWTDAFVKTGYTMITMENNPLAEDVGFKQGYNYEEETEIKRKFTNGEELIINN